MLLPHTIAIESMPHQHRDPFDRMLVAQAIVDGTDPCLPPDRKLTHYAAALMPAIPATWRAAELALEQRHPRHGQRRVATLVALAAAGRARACSMVSQVITPKAQGTPVSSCTSWMPRAASAQTKS